MRLFNKLYGISLFTLLLSVASCTSETEEQHRTSAPDPSGSEARREVMLTLKNKLSVVKTKAGDAIATADENKISSLDIYVFGSTTENGTYTYQERFSYRESSAEMSSGNDVTPLDLTAVGSDGKQTNALLSLKKGLFVKIYCIANQSKLIDPATDTVFNGFIPLVQSNPEQPGNTVTEGTPTESDFLLFKSIQLDPASATDILKTPLPMTGAYATPLDLTDFSVSARLQLGFRLTRSVARFDIVNDAATSKFTIQSVSMANGRRGVSFFPLKVTGTLPTAASGDLITYPARPFDGEKANAGNCLGAFYTWPSPMGDGGYLILSGTYATNQTENVPVTYKVPFKPEGDGNYIEVSQNHRYTVNITKADEYHLDFTINVEDWTDEGNIDDYEPGGEADENGMVVNITDANGTYDTDTRTVTMAITNDVQFTIEGNSTSGYFTTLYYENGDVDHQWLTINPEADYMPTKAEAAPTIYTVSKKNEYIGTKFPVAFIRFTDKISAKETVVIVQPIANPVVKEKTISSGSTIDVDAGEIVLYQSSSVTSPAVEFSVFSSGGSKLEFPDGDTPGNWLTISPATEQDLSQSNYTLTLNSSAADFPDPFPVDGKTIHIVNKGDETKKTIFKLKLKSDITATSAIAGNAEFDASKDILRLYNNPNDKITLNVNAVGGVELDATVDWLTVDKTITDKNTNTYVFSVGAGASTGVSQKLTFRSKADNSITKVYTVYSIKKELVFSNYTDNSDYSSINNISNATPEITYFPCADSYCEFTVVSPKGITVGGSSWAKAIEYSKTILSSGAIQSVIRVQRVYADIYFASFKSRFTITVSNNYPSQSSKSFGISQYQAGIVYPGSKYPANPVNSYWVAPVNSANSISYYDMRNRVTNGTACPSGWWIPSHGENLTIMGISDGNTLAYNLNSYPQVKKAYGNNPGDVYYWASNNDPIGWGLRFFNGWFSTWTLGEKNICNLRCVKRK